MPIEMPGATASKLCVRRGSSFLQTMKDRLLENGIQKAKAYC